MSTSCTNNSNVCAAMHATNHINRLEISPTATHTKETTFTDHGRPVVRHELIPILLGFLIRRTHDSTNQHRQNNPSEQHYSYLQVQTGTSQGNPDLTFGVIGERRANVGRNFIAALDSCSVIAQLALYSIQNRRLLSSCLVALARHTRRDFQFVIMSYHTFVTVQAYYSHQQSCSDIIPG